METMNIYSFSGSQWANVVHLGIAYKKIPQDHYLIHEIDLGAAENFEPDYLQINSNGTVPSLTSPSLPHPLTDSRSILDYLDEQYPPHRQLKPTSDLEKQTAFKIINLVHSESMSTNLVFFPARNNREMESHRQSQWRDFVVTRQTTLLRNLTNHPTYNQFYSDRLKQETPLYKVYTHETIDDNDPNPIFPTFYAQSETAFHLFATGLNELNTLLVLPYAAGPKETEADFHVIPWLAHAMHGAGGVELQDFEPLEALIRVSVPEFVIGSRVKEWWANVSRCEWVREVFPKLH